MSATLIATGIGLVKSWLNGKQKEVRAVSEAKAKKADRQADIKLERIKNASKFLRFYSYFLFSAPIIVTVIFPAHGALIWENLKNVDEWFLNIFLGMNSAIWVIGETGNVYQKVKTRNY